MFIHLWGAQWLSGRVLDSRPKGRGFEPHWRHCVVSLSKNINPCLVLVQPRKIRPFITERLLMGRKESNQTNKQTKSPIYSIKGTETAIAKCQKLLFSWATFRLTVLSTNIKSQINQPVYMHLGCAICQFNITVLSSLM